MWHRGAQKLPERHRFHEGEGDSAKIWPGKLVLDGATRAPPEEWIDQKYAIGPTHGAQLMPPSRNNSMSNTITAAPPASFEEAMAELAQLVTQMESGQLPLEASVAAYARGSELVKYCAAQLEKVEAQVKVLEGDMLKPFSNDADEGAQ